MITTPILDFVRNYAASGAARLHMPGHKGAGPLGCEALDITELDGADDLYAPAGIIAESERNASRLFGAQTYYSAEGSSLAIRAMLFLALDGRAPGGERPLVLAGRNAHRAFLSAAALIDFDVRWLHPSDAYQRCDVSAGDVDAVYYGLERIEVRAGQTVDAGALLGTVPLGRRVDLAVSEKGAPQDPRTSVSLT
ncbi:MAG: arginine decarboxylase, partial [Clostridia bacterium]|nr:arginine decarboxylase [Clostridia bacterium]